MQVHRLCRFVALPLTILGLTGCSSVFGDEHAAHTSRVGTVHFLNSCNANVKAEFERGVAMLHSFWYSAAQSTFREVLAKDPDCAIATWGIAAILMGNPLSGQGASAKDAESAQAAITQGRKIGAKTERERDYIEAVAAYYEDFGKRTEVSRQESRAKAFESLAARYPDDDEARIFAALYVAATQSPADQTYAAYLKAAAVLEKQFEKYPEHPGVAHYLIHAYDAPPIAKQGLVAARKYAGIAPDAPHALHMPSHIFTRVGAWEESAATNARSAEAAIRSGEPEHAYHANDYAVYAYLQLARDGDARRVIETTQEIMRKASTQPNASYSTTAMPVRYAIERGAWAEAMKLETPKVPNPYTDSLTYFGRALGAARLGNVEAAQKDAQQLADSHKVLDEQKYTYWATEVQVQELAIAGWIALAQKKNDEALASMRSAADLEDRNEKHIVTPGRIVPARELLGDMLLELGQPTLALEAYEKSQEREPNRFRGLYGAARAAEAAGDRVKAAHYYNALMILARNADSPRPELARAKIYLAQR